jgi:hypothetical protein
VNVINEIDEIIRELSKILGKPIDPKFYEIHDRGIPHKPKSMPKETMGIYTFWYEGKALKIGKAGPKSNPRFLSQHYNPKSTQSTLAASILRDENMYHTGVVETNVGEWIKDNCQRVDILFSVELGIFTLKLIEAALHYKYDPVYEGFA